MENVKHQRKEGVMVVLENNELKIKSTELVEIINEFRKLESETRKSKYVELRHNDFMAKIKKELEVLKLLDLEGERNFSHGSYIDKQNQARPCFELNRDGMLQMLNSESTLVRYKTIQYINTLENKIKGQAITQLKPLTTEEMLELQFKYAKEVKEEVIELKEDFQELKDNLPLLGIDCDEITSLIKKVCTRVTGYGTQAYKDKSSRGRVYADIYGQLKREFQVKSYKAIKRSQAEKAKEIIRDYKAPTGLLDEISRINNQINFKDVV